MTNRSMKLDDPLDDFAHREITLDGVTKVVHVAGSGPGVIVMTALSWRTSACSMASAMSACAIPPTRTTS